MNALSAQNMFLYGITSRFHASVETRSSKRLRKIGGICPKEKCFVCPLSPASDMIFTSDVIEGEGGGRGLDEWSKSSQSSGRYTSQ